MVQYKINRRLPQGREPAWLIIQRRRVDALVTGLAAVAAVALMLAFVVLPGGSAAVRGPEAVSVGIAAPAVAPAVQETASPPGSPQ